LERVDAVDWNEAELRNRVYETASRRFDLEHGPVFRATLFSMSPKDHLLLLAWHHIAFDGWSLAVAISDLSALYGAYAAGREPDLPPAVPYSQFVRWQRQLVHGDRGQRHRAYWKSRLQDVQPSRLPIERAPRAASTGRCGMVRFAFEEGLTARAKELAAAEGTTLYMVLLAVFFILLERYCGRDRVLLSAPTAGRSEARFAATAGCLVNQIVLQADLSAATTFRDLLAQVKETVLGAFEYQDYPLTVLAPELPQLTGLGFILHGGRKIGNRLGPIELEPFDLEWHATTSDLDVQMIESAGVLWGSLVFRPEVFEEADMRRLTGHFRQLLEAAVTEPSRPIAKLPLLSPEERQAVAAWNATTRVWPDNATLPDLFERQAVQKGDAVAAYCGGQHITYAQLDQRANQVAHYLRDRGVGHETIVGIHMTRSLDLLAAVLGVLKAGAAYVPIDPAYPPERQRFLLEDSRAAIVLDDLEAARGFPCEPVPRQLTGENLAYVIYTSGSTGQPKGVQVPHRALANALKSLRQEPGFTNEDVLLAVTSISFDIAAVELFLPLIAGGRVWIAPQSVSADGAPLARLLAESSASVMQATPATWRMLIDSGWQGTPGLKAWCGGESLPRDLANQLLDRCACLWNLYGPTETTIWSTVSSVKRGEGVVPIGRPIANTEIYVLDSHGQQVSVNVPGELYIGGAGLADGYLNHPELTERSFIASPIPEAANGRLYKTGDLVRYLPDGNLVFLRRNDNQVKLRGYRLELGEVESKLTEHPSVRAAVVTVREDTEGDPKLVAYLLASPEQPPDPDTLRGFLKERLPAQMLPSAFVILNSFPLTDNGKIDRKNLPAPDHSRMTPDAASDSEWDKKAKQLGRIWEEVLGAQKVGLHDDFFALGGHSLLAIRLISKINSTFRVRLPLAFLFEAPTVARLAESLRRGSTGKFNSSLVPIKPDGSGTPFFLISRFSALGFHTLAKYLDPQQPLYGLVPPGPDNGSAPISNVEELAAHYIHEMRKVQPPGPYMVGGYSFGGILAYEVACQLQRTGERVALLFLIDGDAHALPRYQATLPKSVGLKYLLRHWGRGLKYHTQAMLRHSLKQQLGYFVNLTRRQQKALRRQIRKFDADKTLPHALRVVEQANGIAFRAYLPQPYPGKLIQVRSTRGFTGFDLKRHGWVKLAASFEMHELPDCDHLDILAEPYILQVAEILRHSIRAGLESQQDAIKRDPAYQGP
jgi:amino acid adenylation domain-containing protein